MPTEIRILRAQFDGQMCTMGGDCDDTNASIHPGAAEYCDGRDQDCDNEIDEGACTGPDGDTCGNPLRLPLNAVTNGVAGTAFVTVLDKANDYQSACEPGASTRPDAVVAITLPIGLWNVTLEASAGDPMSPVDPILAGSLTCDGAWADGAYGCNDDLKPGAKGSRLWLHGVGHATQTTPYFILVEGSASGAPSGIVRLTVRATPYLPSTCGMNPFDIRGGGSVIGYRGAGVLRASCETRNAGEAIFNIGQAPQGQRQYLDALALDFQPSLYILNRQCREVSGQCAIGTGGQAHLEPTTGNYAVVDGIPGSGGSYTLVNQPSW